MKFKPAELLNFLNSIEGWADKNIEESGPRHGLKAIVIKKNGWTYSDQYVGGEPFQGLEVVWLGRLPVWSMSYRGFWNEDNYNAMLEFVKGALKNPPENAPWRGPKRYSVKEMPDWLYANKWRGTIKEFEGRETISHKGKRVGYTIYQGGLVNRKQVNL